MITVASLARHPVKGFPPEALAAIALVAGAGFPGDRLFAVENGPSGFDPAAPEHFPKIKYLQTMRNPGLWGLDLAWDATIRRLTLARDGQTLAAGSVDTAEGREAIESVLQGLLGAEARGPLRLIEGRGWQFMDSRKGFVSIIGRATLDALSARAQADLDPRRFRANVWVEGLDPWAEFALVGKRVRLGGAVLEVTHRIDRCRAVDANPATGRHDTDLVGLLERAFGHHDVGVYARVLSGGRVAVGDTLATLADVAAGDGAIDRADLPLR
jgi:uncharacterized protein